MYKLNFTTLKCFYLHGDGHAVAKHEKHDPKLNIKVEWIEIYECFNPSLVGRFKGRLIFGSIYSFAPGPVGLLAKAISIVAHADSGSQATRERGYKVNHVGMRGKGWSVDFNEIPELLSGPITYQPECQDKFEDTNTYRWRSYSVAKVHRLEAASEATA